MLSRALSGAGYHVEVAQTGKEGMRKILSSTFDAVLVDLQMPDMNGIEILEEIMTIHESVRPVPIIVTGKTGIGELKDYKHLGVADIVLKPFFIETLFKSLYNSLMATNKVPENEHLISNPGVLNKH